MPKHNASGPEDPVRRTIGQKTIGRLRLTRKKPDQQGIESPNPFTESLQLPQENPPLGPHHTEPRQDDLNKAHRPKVTDLQTPERKQKAILASPGPLSATAPLGMLIAEILGRIHSTVGQHTKRIFKQPPPRGFNIEINNLRGDLYLQTKMFREVNVCCRQIIQSSHAPPWVKDIFRARWIGIYNQMMQLRKEEGRLANPPSLFQLACDDFGMSEDRFSAEIRRWTGYC